MPLQATTGRTASSLGLTYAAANGLVYFTDQTGIYFLDPQAADPSINVLTSNLTNILPGINPDDGLQGVADMQAIGDTLYILTNDGMNTSSSARLWEYDLATDEITLRQENFGNVTNFRVVPEPSASALAACGVLYRRAREQAADEGRR